MTVDTLTQIQSSFEAQVEEAAYVVGRAERHASRGNRLQTEFLSTGWYGKVFSSCAAAGSSRSQTCPRIVDLKQQPVLNTIENRQVTSFRQQFALNHKSEMSNKVRAEQIISHR